MKPIHELIGCLACAALAAALTAPAASAQGRPDRFGGMDRNGDGVITRSEWRGNDRSFANHDWNRDGVLSGDEVRSAQMGARDRAPADEADETDWTEARFASLDRDRDSRLAPEEWRVSSALFDRVDVNDDGTISRREFLGLEYDSSAWREADEDAVSERFEALDGNRDGLVTRDEWPRSSQAFRRRDADRSGALEPRELERIGPRQGTAYDSGYERGVADGRQAGLEDRNRRNRWDLEGQRELESADAGYSQAMGRRDDYQAGYRAGFRVGYAEGFGPR